MGTTIDRTTFKVVQYGFYEPFEWVKLRHGTDTWMVFGGGRPQTEAEAEAHHEYSSNRFPHSTIPERPRTKKQISFSVPMLKSFMPWIKRHTDVTHLLLLCNHSGRIPTMMVQRLRAFPKSQWFKVATFDGQCLSLREDGPRQFSTVVEDSYVYRKRRNSGATRLRFDRPVDIDGVPLTLDMVQERQRKAAEQAAGATE